MADTITSATPATEPAPAKLKVFISYSRQDMSVADELVVDLEAHGFDVTIDRRDLPFGEQWQTVLAEFIVASDAVVWLVSPRSISSEWCRWELGEVESLGKRLVPVRIKQVDNKGLPAAIGRVHILPAEGVYAREAHLPQLVAALNTNRAWLQEHTRLVAIAQHWEKSGRPDDQLMSAADIRATGELLEDRPLNTGAPPQILIALRNKSREKLDDEDRRQRRIIGRAFVKPAKQALDAGETEVALRLCAAGALLARDVNFELVPELWPPIAQAIWLGRQRLAIFGHSAAILDAAFDSMGMTIVTASADKTAKGWATTDGRQLLQLSGHDGSINYVRYGPDSTLLVTASNDGSARIWNATDGSPIACFMADNSKIYSAELSPDQALLIAITENADEKITANIWRVETSSLTCSLSLPAHVTFRIGHPEVAFVTNNTFLTSSKTTFTQLWDVKVRTPILDIPGQSLLDRRHGLSANNQRIVTAPRYFSGAPVEVWNVSTRVRVGEIEGGRKEIYSASISPEGERVVLSLDDSSTRIWNVNNQEQIAALEGHGGAIYDAHFSQDGNKVITTSEGAAYLWDAHDGTRVAVFPHQGLECSPPIFNPNGTQIAVRSGSVLKLCDTHSSYQICAYTTPPNKWADWATFSPEGTHVLTGSRDNTAQLWCAHTGTKVMTFVGHSDVVSSVSFRRDGKRAITASWDKTVRVWNVKDGATLLTIVGHSGKVTSAEYSVDGKLIMTASEDGTICLWHGENGAQIRIFSSQKMASNSASFSPDGSKVIAGVGNLAKIWEVESGKEVGVIKGHGGTLNDACFSEDGAYIVTSAHDGTARLWSSADLNQLLELRASTGDTRTAAISRDGTRILATGDNSARIWDARNGVAIAILEGHENLVACAAFSPNGERAITTSWDGSCRVWDISRTAVATRDKAIVFAALLKNNAWPRTAEEAGDVLMQNAPNNLFEAAINQIGQNRLSEIETMAADLRAPLHPNCYLSPRQFAKMFGLTEIEKRQQKLPHEERIPLGSANPEQRRHADDSASANGKSLIGRSKNEPSEMVSRDLAHSSQPAATTTCRSRPTLRRWLVVGLLALPFAGVAALVVTGQIDVVEIEQLLKRILAR